MLVIDDREDPERIMKLREHFDMILVTRLETGDIEITQNEIGDKNNIIIEVKTIQDFISSSNNRRIQKEALQMRKDHNFSYIIIYDDGKLNEVYSQQSNNQKFGNIASLMIRYKVPVFWADNFNQFVACIKAIINTVSKDTEPLDKPIVRKKSTNPMINVLIGIDGVGEKMARKLLDKFGKPSAVLNATEEELDKIPRLSKKSKDAILRM